MIAKEIISKNVFPIRITDSAEEALSLMTLYRLKELAVVENDKLIGILTEEEAYALNDEESINGIVNQGIVEHVVEETHLFELISKLADHNLTMLPVLSKEGKFLGVITQEDVFKYYANSFSFTEAGSIIVLDVVRKEYSMAEISQIVESENAAILSSFLSDAREITRIMVTLKINKQDIQAIVAGFERYGYEVKASFTEQEYIDNLKERYDLLMHYLNV